MGMTDVKKFINELTFQLNSKAVKEEYSAIQLSVSDTEKLLALLKEQEWHIFHERELDEEEKQEHPEWNWIMDVDCTPGNGEEFLHYRKCNGSINITTWDDDLWAEYCDTGDGDPIEDGDAWMELPKPPSK